MVEAVYCVNKKRKLVRTTKALMGGSWKRTQLPSECPAKDKRKNASDKPYYPLYLEIQGDKNHPQAVPLLKICQPGETGKGLVVKKCLIRNSHCFPDLDGKEVFFAIDRLTLKALSDFFI